jgi:hypothetical protein
MNNPYELAKNILQSEETEEQPARTGLFTSINLYGASVHENGADGGNFVRLQIESAQRKLG